MTVEIIIPYKDPKKPPVLKFPACCVCCGNPQETTMKASLNMGVQKHSKTVMMENIVPMCNSCSEKERSITKVTLVPFLIAGFVTLVIVFIPVWLITPGGNTPETYAFSITAGTLAGIIAGVIVGTLVEFVLKFFFAPFYGQLLLKRPLTVFSLFDDSADFVGLSFKFGGEKKSLILTFENDDIARKFKSQNP